MVGQIRRALWYIHTYQGVDSDMDIRVRETQRLLQVSTLTGDNRDSAFVLRLLSTFVSVGSALRGSREAKGI